MPESDDPEDEVRRRARIAYILVGIGLLLGVVAVVIVLRFISEAYSNTAGLVPLYFAKAS